jgi:hypothetical protein
MKMRFFLGFAMAIITVLSFTACDHEPGDDVGFHTPGAKWEGRFFIGECGMSCSEVRCCKPGSNCADRKIYNHPFPLSMRSYVTNDNLAGYFKNENWQAALPELVPYPQIVAFITANNPKALFASDGGSGEAFIIFKERSQPLEGTANVLFALTNKDMPCPD